MTDQKQKKIRRGEKNKKRNKKEVANKPDSNDKLTTLVKIAFKVVLIQLW